MKVSEIMTAAPAACTPETTLAEAARLMWESDCGVLPVVDDGELAGIVTDRDMFIALGTRNARAALLRVGAIATTKIATCGPDDEVEAVLATMSDARVRRLPVVDANRTLIGIISLSDIALAAGDSRPVRDRDVVAALQRICARPVPPEDAARVSRHAD
jgi:CBS domain-containing protein